MSEQIIKTEFSDVMQKSYIDYAMSVISAGVTRCAGWFKTSTAKSTVCDAGVRSFSRQATS